MKKVCQFCQETETEKERNRTIKIKMCKQCTVQCNAQYLEILSKILKQYNNTKHSSTKMTPIEASKKKNQGNQGTVYFNLYGDMDPLSWKPKFNVGDKDSECFLKSYDDIVNDVNEKRSNPEECIEIINMLSKAIGNSRKKIVHYSALQGDLSQSIK